MFGFLPNILIHLQISFKIISESLRFPIPTNTDGYCTICLFCQD